MSKYISFIVFAMAAIVNTLASVAELVVDKPYKESFIIALLFIMLASKELEDIKKDQ